MFTGLIRHLGRIRELQKGAESLMLVIEHNMEQLPRRGDSVAVNGVCLTVGNSEVGWFGAECFYATLGKTTLKELAPGDRVHLEKPMKLGDALDGHLLQGHVNGTAAVLDSGKVGDGVCLTVEMPQDWEHCFVSEGSVAIDGVSLTVADIGAGFFSIQLIGETLERTLLSNLKRGDRVNMETDFLLRRAPKVVGAGRSEINTKKMGEGMKISVEEAARRLAAGEMVIITDDDDREDEGDLVGAARFATPQMINFMVSRARGLVCCALEKPICERAGLELLNDKSGAEAIHGTRFCSSIDLIDGCTTGISAFDRSRTIMRLVDKDCRPNDFARPGHIFPIMEADGGLSSRNGHTEASVYLARLAGLEGAAVICEMMDDDGQMARGKRIEELSAEWGIGVLGVGEVIEHMRLRHSQAVPMNTEYGDFLMDFLGDEGEEHFCLYQEGRQGQEAHPDGPLVRVHSECLTGDMLGSQRCDCGSQLKEALKRINDEGEGYVVYMRQEGRGIGLRAKLQAYRLQDEGMDTIDSNLHLGYEADGRDYSAAAEYLRSRGIKKIRLLTNNPDKIRQLKKGGLEPQRVALYVGETPDNADYLRTKKERMGHL